MHHHPPDREPYLDREDVWIELAGAVVKAAIHDARSLMAAGVIDRKGDLTPRGARLIGGCESRCDALGSVLACYARLSERDQLREFVFEGGAARWLESVGMAHGAAAVGERMDGAIDK